MSRTDVKETKVDRPVWAATVDDAVAKSASV